jgi:hypothetical protein
MLSLSSTVRRLGVALALTLCFADLAAGQNPLPPLDRPLRVFLDCRGPGCDGDFFKKELHWVDHMNDQTDADVHVLVTARPSGGGGISYSVQLIGRDRWEGQQQLIGVSTEAGETSDGQRRALLRVFALLLARYAAETPIGPKLGLQPIEATTGAQTKAADDPWNFWVYRINFNSFLNGQQNDKSGNFNFNTSANHTTDAWKININAGFNYSESRFVLSDGTFYSYRRGRNLNTLVVKSLSDHWSAGAMVRMSRSTFNNQRLNLRIAPGIEYNFFPYKESTTRRFTLQWTAGINRFKYDQETIFGKLAETHWDEQLLAIFSLDKPWGNVGVTGELAHLFDDFGKYRTSVFMDANIRLFRGFSFNVFGDYSVLHDQLYLPRAGATDEEIIARQQQLQTNYRYFMSVGITYRFGSINNNIVNQRFGG